MKKEPEPQESSMMAGLFRNNPDTPEGKYLVKRRDGTVPQWPWFVLAASDPAAPTALRAYAQEARRLGMDEQYCSEVLDFADEFQKWMANNPQGDPDAPRHRTDDPETIAEMRKGHSA